MTKKAFLQRVAAAYWSKEHKSVRIGDQGQQSPPGSGVGFARTPLLFEDFLGLLVGQLADLLLELLQEGLHLLLARVALVLGHLLVLLGHVEVLVAVAADVAAGDLG